MSSSFYRAEPLAADNSPGPPYGLLQGEFGGLGDKSEVRNRQQKMYFYMGQQGEAQLGSVFVGVVMCALLWLTYLFPPTLPTNSYAISSAHLCNTGPSRGVQYSGAARHRVLHPRDQRLFRVSAGAARVDQRLQRLRPRARRGLCRDRLAHAPAHRGG
jgi:hypothetical protein